MPPKETKMKRTLLLGAAISLLAAPLALADEGHNEDAAAVEHETIELQMAMPQMNADRGRVLFAEKGCVACHSVNGVGGEDATPLDAHDMEQMMNPFELAAKMWAMAPYMIEAQEEALGEQILFSGDELADIIAFLHSDENQHMLTEASLSPEVLKMMDHAHGEMPGEEAHEEELGHSD
jgi:mono/diheme cytochrome c family protein